VRDLEAAGERGDAAARLALEVFVYQVKKAIGHTRPPWAAWTRSPSPAASASTRPACGGVVAPISAFWASSWTRSATRAGPGDRLVSAPTSHVDVVTLATDEELVVARRAYRLLSAG